MAGCLMTCTLGAGAADLSDLSDERQEHYQTCKSFYDADRVLIASRYKPHSAYGRALLAMEAVQVFGYERELWRTGVVRPWRHPVYATWTRLVELSIELDALLARTQVPDSDLMEHVVPATDVLWADLMSIASVSEGEPEAKTLASCLVNYYEDVRDQVLEHLPEDVGAAERDQFEGILEKKVALAAILAKQLEDAGVDHGALAADFAGATVALQRYAMMRIERPLASAR